MSNNGAYAMPRVNPSVSKCTYTSCPSRSSHLRPELTTHISSSIQNNIPLQRRPLLRPHLLHPPPTSRPPQNPRPTVPAIPPPNPQNHSLLSTSHPRPMARNTPLSPTDRLRIRPVFHQPERPPPSRCPSQHPPRPGQFDRSQILLRPAKTLQHREPRHRRHRPRRRRLHNDAGHGAQGALRV